MTRYKNFIFILVLILSLAWGEIVSAKVKKSVLPDGLTVLTKEDHSQPILAVQLWVKTGSALEDESNSGVSHFIEHMLFKGTARLPGPEIAKTIEAKGGVINAATSKDFTYYHLILPSEQADTALEVITDIVLNSVLAADELEKERLVILEEINRQDDNTQSVLWNLFNKNIYKTIPYARPVIGTSDTIKNMSRQTLLDYYHRFYVPNNMSLIIAGDFATGSVMAKIKNIFAAVKAGKLEPAVYTSVNQEASLSEDKREVQQAHLILGTLGPPVTSRDQYALDIAAYILGGGRSSRLYRKIQEEKKLVHSIGATFLTLKGQGPFYITATCEPAKIPLVKEAILAELSQIKSEKPSAEELKRAKSIIRSEYLLSNQTYDGQAFNLGYYETVDTYKFNETYLANIDKITAEDILRVVNKYIDPDKMATVIIEPKDKKKK